MRALWPLGVRTQQTLAGGSAAHHFQEMRQIFHGSGEFKPGCRISRCWIIYKNVPSMEF